MTTAIAPSAGQNVGLLQAGPGAVGYGAIDWRRIVAAEALQEGVFVAGAYKVTAGGALNVSIAASTGSGALVQGDNIASQGLYYVAPHSAAIVEANTAAHATLPRIDQVILEVLDATHDGGGSNTARTRIVDGVATSGATLDNRNGAAVLPNNAIRLADVLIPAAAVSVLAGNIRDRRTHARGASRRILRNANAAAGNDYTTTSASAVAIDATNLTTRLECTGNLIKLKLTGQVGSSVAADTIAVEHRMDTAAIDGGALAHYAATTITFGYALEKTWEFAPAAGSHVFTPYYYRAGGSGNATIFARAAIPLSYSVEEVVRPNTDNT